MLALAPTPDLPKARVAEHRHRGGEENRGENDDPVETEPSPQENERQSATMALRVSCWHQRPRVGPMDLDYHGVFARSHVVANLGLGFVAFLMQTVLAGGAVVFLDRKGTSR